MVGGFSGAPLSFLHRNERLALKGGPLARPSIPASFLPPLQKGWQGLPPTANPTPSQALGTLWSGLHHWFGSFPGQANPGSLVLPELCPNSGPPLQATAWHRCPAGYTSLLPFSFTPRAPGGKAQTTPTRLHTSPWCVLLHACVPHPCVHPLALLSRRSATLSGCQEGQGAAARRVQTESMAGPECTCPCPGGPCQSFPKGLPDALRKAKTK